MGHRIFDRWAFLTHPLIKCCRWKKIKEIKGWKVLKHECGYFNEATGQTLVVSQKQYGQDYVVLVFVGPRPDEEKKCRIVSPEFPTEAKAQVYANNLMIRNPNGIP